MSEDEKGPRDWGEWEAQGVPVLDFFLHALGEMGQAEFAAWVTGVEEAEQFLNLRVEWLAELWLAHHPNAARTEPEQRVGALRDPRVTYTQSPAMVPVCGHVSKEDPSRRTHTCALPVGHDRAGIPHEDAEYRWFSADSKPFRKIL